MSTMDTDNADNGPATTSDPPADVTHKFDLSAGLNPRDAREHSRRRLNWAMRLLEKLKSVNGGVGGMSMGDEGNTHWQFSELGHVFSKEKKQSTIKLLAKHCTLGGDGFWRPRDPKGEGPL